jgi:hypothetical protein
MIIFASPDWGGDAIIPITLFVASLLALGGVLLGFFLLITGKTRNELKNALRIIIACEMVPLASILLVIVVLHLPDISLK